MVKKAIYLFAKLNSTLLADIKVNNKQIVSDDVSISEINSRILVFKTAPYKGDLIKVSFPIGYLLLKTLRRLLEKMVSQCMTK